MSETTETAILVLMIDDDEDDVLLIRKLLSGAHGARYRVDWAANYADGLARLCEGCHDICLLDYNLGASNGLELLGEARRKQCLTPVILLTGLGAEEVDRAAMEAGALDYLSKVDLTAGHLERSIRYGLQQARILQALLLSREELEHKVEERTAELVASEARLREADRRKDEFLAMLAHELRNPLAPIRNAVQLMRMVGSDQALLDKQRDMIDRQVTHMGRLLDDLLDVSRITRGKIQLKREKLDLRVVAEQAIDSMRSLIDGKGLQLAYQAASAPLPVDGDPTRLEQVLRNLLQNAVKYTEVGGCIWLGVGLEADGEQRWWATAHVRDSGIGIAPELLRQVFDPFVQAEQSLARTQGGLGIGLSMVKRLVEMHSGQVEARSRGLGQGSEFVIRLPLIAEIAAKSGAAKPAELRAQAGGANKIWRILVVDDNEDAAASLSDLLEIWGHQVRTAYDGRQALVAAREWLPEVILLDIGLPGMDGYEVARHLRAEPANGEVFIVALTGYGAEEDRRRALEAGFNQHLIKPVELEQLHALLS